jgi:hypothetical protein
VVSHIEPMMKSHPRPMAANAANLVACLQACLDCLQACTACADACLGEAEPQRLVQCIRLNLDCADVCDTTGRLLSRQTEAHGPLLRAMLETCALACDACQKECERHAHHHEHCRVCAEACRQCAEACRALIVGVPAEAA